MNPLVAIVVTLAAIKAYDAAFDRVYDAAQAMSKKKEKGKEGLDGDYIVRQDR